MDAERIAALLRAWAAWSRADDRLVGYRPRRDRKAAGLLTDAEALRVDRAVSRVPEPYRSLLIAIYVRRVPLAVAAFDLPLLVNASTAHAFALRLLGESLRNASGGLRSGDQARGRHPTLTRCPAPLIAYNRAAWTTIPSAPS